MNETLMLQSGRNPIHIAFGDSVHAEQYFIESPVYKKQFLPSKVFSFFRNSLSIPVNFRTILCESNYYYPALKKQLGLLRSRIINVAAGPTLYNLWTNRITGIEKKMLLGLLPQVNGHLVLGEFGKEILQKIDPNAQYQIVYPFISDERLYQLDKLHVSKTAKQITIFASEDWYCKGLDLVIEAFTQFIEHNKKNENEILLNICGNVKKDELKKFDRNFLEGKGKIRYLGKLNNISKIFEETAVYIQPSRGDMFPVSVLEAMLAGIPAIVSEHTGTKEVVQKINPDLVCKINASDLTQKLQFIFDMEKEKKRQIIENGKTLAKSFNRTDQLKHFREQFELLKKQT